jgi:hypothetical protein
VSSLLFLFSREIGLLKASRVPVLIADVVVIPAVIVVVSSSSASVAVIVVASSGVLQRLLIGAA